MKRILVTGANGFIGRHVLPLLIKREFEVHGVVSPKHSLPSISKDYGDVQWHSCNLLDVVAHQDLIKAANATHLLHLAWETTHGKFWNAPVNLAWLSASANLARLFFENGGRRLVCAGTCAEYEWSDAPLREGYSPYNPSTLYGICKASLRQAVSAYSKEVGLSTAWGHVFFLFGPFEPSTKIVAATILNLLQNKPIGLSEGNQVRDFMFVKDVAAAFAALVDSNLDGAFNVATGNSCTLRELLLNLASVFERCDLLHFGKRPTPTSEPLRIEAHVGRLRDELGFQPTYSLQDGLKLSIDWWRTTI